MMAALARNKDGSRVVLVIGLSFENLRRLQAKPGDDYITIRRERLGPSLPCDVTIFAGETEAACVDVIREFISSETEVVIDPKLKS